MYQAGEIDMKWLSMKKKFCFSKQITYFHFSDFYINLSVTTFAMLSMFQLHNNQIEFFWEKWNNILNVKRIE